MAELVFFSGTMDCGKSTLARLIMGLLPPTAGEVLVTGAAGGVGSVAVALLAGAGYRVAAVTGRPETAGYLQELGAARIIPRAALAEAAAELATTLPSAEVVLCDLLDGDAALAMGNPTQAATLSRQ